MSLLSGKIRNVSVGHRMHGIVEEDEDSLESAEIDSTSSFSLQECIDEFRARRIRRVSTHSRDTAVENCPLTASADADLINQNRCNKEQERKCKPCKNGFCYCFSSDSGDAATRDIQSMRQTRRSRRSDNQIPCSAHHRQRTAESQQRRRHSAPSKIKSKQISSQSLTTDNQREGSETQRTLTAISSVKTAPSDAPLIHIIQELHDNCVISEVHVNKHKLRNLQNNRRQSKEDQKSMSNARCEMKFDNSNLSPSVPAFCNISDLSSQRDNCSKTDIIQTSSLEQSSKGRNGSKRRNKAAGLLLQRRLSKSQVKCKTWQSKIPPPKPPRLDTKASVSSLASTSLSVKEAERVLDEFLRKKGVQLPVDLSSQSNNKRKSYPLYRKDGSLKSVQPLPTCPSLSDIERVFELKKSTDYLKNMHKINSKPKKDIQLGWTDPEISRMLNYDIDDPNNQRNYIKSKFEQAEPQTVGWHIPHKVSLDTVDGNVKQNLASNIENKHTPVKSPAFINKNKSAGMSQKFIWSEQLRNLSPWSSKKRPSEKSSLKTSSKNFLRHSKKKILRIVSPKKNNTASQDLNQKETTLRTIGVQTSNADFCEKEVSRQTPPGSYHSPMQSSNTGTTLTQNDELCEPGNAYFDFSRNIKPPPRSKHHARSRGRKLEFPLCNNVNSCLNRDNNEVISTETYRSYQANIDQDINLSKMGHLLKNIRSKLEASDNFAIRVFQEVEQRENDSNVRESECQPNLQKSRNMDIPDCGTNYNEPIYSEIEDDSVHVSSSPQYDNTAALSRNVPVYNINDLYAKVQKTPKVPVTQTEHIPLAKLLHESLKYKSLRHIDSSGISNSCSSLRNVAQPKQTSVWYHSLNNINEKHSPPKNNRNVCKSDLSLHRSEIFLDNLCQSEIVLDRDNSECLVKVPNAELNVSNTSGQLSNIQDTDTVSYDLPDDNNHSSNSGDSNLGLSIINPPESKNQSTPKKEGPRYTSKQSNLSLPEDFVNHSSITYHQNESPTSENNRLSLSGLSHCKLIRNVLQRSYRTGKKILWLDKFSPRSTASTIRDQANRNGSNLNQNVSQSSSILDTLLDDVGESLPATEQLSRVVNICRHMPELEVSSAMVEAERLLLFSTLSRKVKRNVIDSTVANVQRVWIDRMTLPVKANATQDIFFNYHFICTFECNGCIKSTQSVECQNGRALFEDCGIEFFLSTNAEDLKISCKIFMLRLRKISTLYIDTPTTSNMVLRRASSATSDSSYETLTSRFRLHASFLLIATNFVPYNLVLTEALNNDQKICLRASNPCCLPITIHTKSSNLTPKIQFVGRVEINFVKKRHAGFLNFRDTKIVHNWNRRWCTLEGLDFAVWQDVNTPSNSALFAINLKDCLSIDISPRDLCARPRTFFLRLTNCRVLNESLVFFAAETQPELDDWLSHLRNALDFVYKWL